MTADTARRPGTLPVTHPDGLVLRRIDADEPAVDGWLDNVALVFHDTTRPTPETTALRRGVYAAQRLSGAFDGDLVVGTFRSWDTTLTVPGGAGLVADAISSVTVRPTHRRRGILTALMAADLEDAAARGTAVAVLIASEAMIYGRYGFAPATRTATHTVDTRRAVLRPEVPRAGRVDVVPEARAREVAEQVYAAARTPGEIDRLPHWWDHGFGTKTFPGETRGVHQAVLHTADDGTVTGYASYRIDDKWEDRQILTTLTLRELRTATPAAYAALWDYLLSVDLVATVKAQERPVDEALPWLLGDLRAVRTAEVGDFQWHRLLDPAAALSARRYEQAGAATVAVVDPAGYASGTYVLETDADGAGRCTRTSAAPDVTLPVDVLSAVWLGGGDLRAALWAGRGREERTGGGARLAALLATATQPWTCTWF